MKSISNCDAIMSSTIYFGWDRVQTELILSILMPNEIENIKNLFSQEREKFFSESTIVNRINSSLENLAASVGTKVRIFRFDSGIYLNSQNYYLCIGPRFINEVYNRDNIPELSIKMEVFVKFNELWEVLNEFTGKILPCPSIINLIAVVD